MNTSLTVQLTCLCQTKMMILVTTSLGVMMRAGQLPPECTPPLELFFPFSTSDPQLTEDEMARLIHVADQHEISRLERMTVLQPPLEGVEYSKLSTRFVRSFAAVSVTTCSSRVQEMRSLPGGPVFTSLPSHSEPSASGSEAIVRCRWRHLAIC